MFKFHYFYCLNGRDPCLKLPVEKAGLRIKLSKCEFMKPSETYLGHKIDEQGLHPVAEKVEAINNAPIPMSVQELKSYLGLLTYNSKFYPRMSDNLVPLYRLLQKDQPWKARLIPLNLF